MLLFFYIILILYLIFIRRKQKYTWLISACMICLLSITTTFYADLDNYIPLFNYYNSSIFSFTVSSTNIIWIVLCKLFYFLGFNYRGMVIGLIFFNYFILHKSVQNMKCNENIFFGLFLIFPSIIQLVQLKFFTAFTIIVFAYSVMLLEKKKSMITFIILTLFASLIHNSAIFFLILIFTKQKKLKNNTILIISIISAFFISMNINWIIGLAKYFISTQQYDRYFIETITPSSLLWILGTLASWMVCYIFGLLVFKYRKNSEGMEYNTMFDKNIMSIILLLFVIPLLLIDRNMNRFLEIGFIILYFMFGNIMKNDKHNKKSIILMLCLILSLNFVMYIYTPYESVLKPLFSYENVVNIRR